MHDYFYLRFPLQLRRLRFETTPRHIDEIFRLDSAQFFGGEDWQRVEEDLSGIPGVDRARFILSLFMIVVTDQTLYTYNAKTYDTWRDATRYPKFGWFGYDVHYGNPLKLLWAPENAELIDAPAVIAEIPAFVDFFVTETERVVIANGYASNLNIHFANMRNDPAWAFNRGIVVPAFKAALDARFPPQI
ncbi:hypothetical protein OU994_07345 [Pseudoduganella sp. SL102]|uniref:hypothetical protein n=1 Tax=Pseudoduganella sp. SL102 TaxID=2995154 RepID=UPI00248B10FF|nr:hypothetical protein [Pseudoduganella sp. SL102]WBS04091.1 hypothetical protein OU994_07345 [Pseudoduganella sp. SL102]